jgi:hypothetical protein
MQFLATFPNHEGRLQANLFSEVHAYICDIKRTISSDESTLLIHRSSFKYDKNPKAATASPAFRSQSTKYKFAY